MADDARIGMLNGKWSVMFRATLAAGVFALPSLLALEVWQVVTIQEMKVGNARHVERLNGFMSVGDRYTPTHARADQIELKDRILREVSESYPPTWLTDELRSMARRLEAVEQNN